MYVIAHHRILDPVRFRALAEAPVADRPVHWRLVSAAPTRDGAACFSLWWADSAAALQRVLARAAGDAGSVECHEVDEEDALGLDERPVVLIRVAAAWCSPAGGAGPRQVAPCVAPSSGHAAAHPLSSIRRHP
jgi:hypothetical protein